MILREFPFAIGTQVEVPAPEGSRVVGVQVRNSVPQVYAEVDDSKPLGAIVLRVIGNGREVPAGCVFRGTIQLPNSIHHVYEEIPAKDKPVEVVQ